MKSEGTRAVVNMIRSLWTSAGGTASTVASPIEPKEGAASLLEKAKKRQECIRLISTHEVASVLASLIERSTKYPLLVNEGVVALSLLASQSTSCKHRLSSILYSLTPLQL